MSLVGLGRAFNLRYRPNGPLRFNCYQRQMPIMFGRDRNVSITENYNIQTTPGGFWGFLSGLTQGFFSMSMLTGGLFGGGGGLFGIFNSKHQDVTAPTTTAGEDTHLKNLTDFYGKNFIIKSHPDKKGIYQAVPKEGGKPIEGTYDELMEKLGVDNEEPKVKEKEKEKEKEKAELKAEPELKAKEEAELKAKEEAKLKAKEEAELKAANNDNVNRPRKTKRLNAENGVNKAKETQKTEKVDENAYKNKAYKVKISLQYEWHFNTCIYTATGTFTDDKGQKHDINLPQQKVEVASWSFASKYADQAIAKDIGPKLKAKAKELGFPNLNFILPKDIANAKQ